MSPVQQLSRAVILAASMACACCVGISCGGGPSTSGCQVAEVIKVWSKGRGERNGPPARERRKPAAVEQKLMLGRQTRTLGAKGPHRVPHGTARCLVGYGTQQDTAPEGLHLTVRFSGDQAVATSRRLPLDFRQGGMRWHDLTFEIPKGVQEFSFEVGPPDRPQSAEVELSAPACLSSEPKRNLVLISIDTLRADYLNTYGYEQYPTSPSLDELAARGTLFEWAVAPSPWTVPSHMSIFTGFDPNALGMDEFVEATPRLDPNRTTLAEVFRAAGYLTVAFTGTATMAGHHGFADGFYLYQESLGRKQWLHRDLDTNIYLARTWLSEHVDRPMFLFFHTFEVHAPYVHSRFLHPSLRGPSAAKARYASGIAHTDERLGAFLGELDTLGVTRDALVVVVSDHGEGFEGEHVALHGRTLFDEVLHVPLIMVGPDIPKGKRVRSQVPLQDLFATLLDYFELPIPQGVESTSLLPYVRDVSKEERAVYLCCMAYDYQRQGYRSRGFKYTMSWPIEGMHENLYNLSEDPREQRDVAADNNDVLIELRKLTVERTERNRKVALEQFAPKRDDAEYEEYAEQLRALGYIH